MTRLTEAQVREAQRILLPALEAAAAAMAPGQPSGDLYALWRSADQTALQRLAARWVSIWKVFGIEDRGSVEEAGGKDHLFAVGLFEATRDIGELTPREALEQVPPRARLLAKRIVRAEAWPERWAELVEVAVTAMLDTDTRLARAFAVATPRQQELLDALLVIGDGNVAGAARQIGMDRRTAHEHLRRLRRAM
jgi:hypothetical protein